MGGFAGELVVEKTEKAWILGLRGEHDLSTRPTIDAEIEAVLAHGTNIIVDLTDTTFMDSSVMGSLLRGYRDASAKPGDSLVIVAPPKSLPRRKIDAVALARLVPV